MFKPYERPQFQLHRPKSEFRQIKWEKQNIQDWNRLPEHENWRSALDSRTKTDYLWPGFKQPKHVVREDLITVLYFLQ